MSVVGIWLKSCPHLSTTLTPTPACGQGGWVKKETGGAISQKWQHFYRSFTEESVLRIASKGAPFFDAWLWWPTCSAALGRTISFIADENNYLTIAKVSIATLAGILVAIAFAWLSLVATNVGLSWALFVLPFATPFSTIQHSISSSSRLHHKTTRIHAYVRGTEIWPPVNEEPIRLSSSFAGGEIPASVRQLLYTH